MGEEEDIFLPFFNWMINSPEQTGSSREKEIDEKEIRISIPKPRTKTG